MKLRTFIKIVASAALLLDILAAIVLFGSIRNIASTSSESMLISYLSIFAVILIPSFLFLLFMISETGTEATNPDMVSTSDIFEEDRALNNLNPSEKQLDIEELKHLALGFVPKSGVDASMQTSLKDFAEESLSLISKAVPITEGIFYLKEEGSDEFVPLGDYAYFSEKPAGRFKLGETLPGQVAKNKQAMNLSDIPEDYVKVASGLGQGSPRHLYFLPLLNNDEAIAVIELASFKEFNKETEKLFELGANELSAALVRVKTRNL